MRPKAQDASLPVEQAPVEQAPVEQAPVEQAPVEQAPVEQALSGQTPKPLTGMILEQPPRRLRSVACDPGTLQIRVLNRPLAEYQVGLLSHHGVTRVIRSSNGGGRGTPSSAIDADADARGPVLVLDGNLLTNADVSAMLRFHVDCLPAATVMITAGHRSASRGSIVDGGMCILEAQLVRALLSRSATVRRQGFLATLHALRCPCVGWYSSAYSCAIHTPAAYHAAHMDLLSGRVSMLLDPPGRYDNGSWVDADVTIGPDAVIEPPCVIGAGTDVGAGARVGPRAVVGSHNRLGPDVRITDSVLGAAVVVGRSAILDGCVVGDDARIGPFSILAPGAVLAGGTVLRSRTLLPR